MAGGKTPLGVSAVAVFIRRKPSSVFLEIFADRVGRAVKQLKVKGRAVDDIDYNYEDRRNFTVEQIYKIGFRLRVLGC